MNILYIDDLNVHNPTHIYPYYIDLYKSLCKYNEVTLSGYVDDINEILKYSYSNCIIFGMGFFGGFNSVLVNHVIKGIHECCIPKIAVLHKPQTLLNEKLQWCKNNGIDLLIYSQKEHEEYGRIAGIQSKRLSMAGDHTIYFNMLLPKIYDFGFSGALHGNDKISGPTRNLRTRVYEKIKDKNIRLFWNGSDSVIPRIKDINEYAKTVHQSNIWLSTTGPMEDVSPRYFEVMLSKTLLFCNEMTEQYENIFRDGDNCVIFKNDLSDFDEKLEYYLKDHNKRLEIINRAHCDAINNHTWDVRAQQLVETINGLKQIF